MTASELLTTVGPVAGVALTALVTWLIAKQGRRVTREEHFVDNLMRRLTDLETREERLQQRVETLEANVREERRWRWQAVGYIRTLRDTLRAHHISTPEPPEGLTLD